MQMKRQFIEYKKKSLKERRSLQSAAVQPDSLLGVGAHFHSGESKELGLQLSKEERQITQGIGVVMGPAHADCFYRNKMPGVPVI